MPLYRGSNIPHDAEHKGLNVICYISNMSRLKIITIILTPLILFALALLGFVGNNDFSAISPESYQWFFIIFFFWILFVVTIISILYKFISWAIKMFKK